MRDWGLGAFDYCTPRFFFVSLGFSRARVLLRRLIVFSAIDQLSATHSIWKSSFDSATGSLLMRVQLRCPYVKLKCEILHDLIICSGVRGMPPKHHPRDHPVIKKRADMQFQVVECPGSEEATMPVLALHRFDLASEVGSIGNRCRPKQAMRIAVNKKYVD